MHVGDLLYESGLCLWVIKFIDFKGAVLIARQLTNDTGVIYDDSYSSVTTIEGIGSNRFQVSRWNGPTYISIMKNRPLPLWATALQNGVSSSVATTYPIGSLFIGTGKSQNVWIINNDDSTDISLLWTGKTGQWCNSETDRQDRLASPRTPDEIQDVLDFVNKNFVQKLTSNSFPQWALKLMWKRATKMKAAPAPIAPQTALGGHYGMFAPAVQSAMVKANILAAPKEEPKKKVATVQELCHHEFRHYIGVTEVYDFCTICDYKIRAKQ